MLFLVFESLSPGPAADVVARLLPCPPSLCAVGGVMLNYQVLDTSLMSRFPSAGTRCCQVCVHHFINHPKQTTNDPFRTSR